MQNLNNQKILSFCQNNIEKIVLILLSLAWAPLSFYNFDSHHDGLILSTVTLTKSALISGGEYPFNQYGPIWAIPFVVLSFIMNSELLFISMRMALNYQFSRSYYFLLVSHLQLISVLISCHGHLRLSCH